MTEIARARVAELCEADRTFQEAGMEVVAVDETGVELQMVVREGMTNGAGVLHGGWIFLLADTAFAYTAATQAPGTLTTDADIRFHRPARLGDRITAVAQVVERVGATILVDVAVTGHDGVRLASMRAAGRAPQRRP